MYFRPPLRAASLVAASALAAATLAAFSPPASAVVIANANAVADVGFFFSGNCTQNPAPGGASQTVAFTADGVAKTARQPSSATTTHNVDATDVTTANGSTSSTATATQSAGQLNKVTVNTSYSASIQPTKGTAQQCNAEVGVQSGAEYTFDLVAPAYVTVTLESRGGQAQAVVGQGYRARTGGHHRRSRRFWTARHRHRHCPTSAGTNHMGVNFRVTSLRPRPRPTPPRRGPGTRR